jgi:prepilin-type N-terminal cleavage/methylation domain-containing protein
MKAPRGFTVLELVIVVAVAGIIAAVMIPAF